MENSPKEQQSNKKQTTPENNNLISTNSEEGPCFDDLASVNCNEIVGQGIIRKGIGSFYTVYCAEGEIVCRLRGKLRQDDLVVCIGDRVEFAITDQEKKVGVIDNILPRKNSLVRPRVANLDQSLLVFAAVSPKPDWLLLDKMLVMSEYNRIEPIICINKWDMLSRRKEEALMAVLADYQAAGFKVIPLSAVKGLGIEELQQALKDKISVFSGQSGVGKSSLINCLVPDLSLATGGLSMKVGRGKHTTRHVELLELFPGAIVADTPGFSLLDLPLNIKEEELQAYYADFQGVGKCRFDGCLHYKEPDCVVKQQVEAGYISQGRYDRYLMLLEQLIAREEIYHD